MKSEKIFLPSEVNSFFISRGFFKNILRKRIGDEIKSMEVEDNEVNITLSGSFLKKALKDKYDKEISSVEIEPEKIEIDFSESSKE